MGFLEWLLGPPAPVAVTEAASPKPREELKAVEPIGYPTELNPQDKADRKNPTAAIQASLQAAQERTRAARYADFAAMDTSDIAALIDAVVDAALTFEDVSTGRGFKVEADDLRTQELLNAAAERADLRQLAEEVLRDMLKNGDAFVEPVFAGPDLVWAQTYQPSEMIVNRNDKGQLVGGKDDDGFPAAFQQRKQGTTVAGWLPHEMVHFRFWPSRRLKYSEKSLLDGLRADWRKLQMVEQGMVIARVTRAYPRRVHYLDVSNKSRGEQETTLLNYINRMTKRRFGQKPQNSDNLPIVDVSEDLYITTGYDTGSDGKQYPKLNKTEIEDPATAGLAELADVTYLRQKLFAQVPSDVVGIKRSNNAGEMDGQDIAYARLLRRCQRQLEKGLRGIFDQVLLANGRLPSKTPYRITFPLQDVKASWKHSDARFRATMAMRNVLEMGMASRRWGMRQLYNLSDLEIDQVWKELEEEAKNPIFQAMLAPARDGLPSIGGEVSGQVNKAGNDGGKPAPTAPQAVTKNGIDRGTDLGQKLRGSMSGG